MYYNLNIYVPSFKYLEYKSRERNFFDVHIQSGNNACSSSTSNILEIKENCTSGYFLTWLTNQREMVYNPSFLLLLSVKNWMYVIGLAMSDRLDRSSDTS